MTRKILIGIILLINILNAKAQSDLEKDIAQVSLFYPIGTQGNHSGNHAYNFSLNLIAGVTGSVSGFELGGLGNINRVDIKGVQLGGLFNATSAGFYGLRTAGIFNIAGKKASGLQIGGLLNLNKSNFTGLQIAGIINLNKGETKGVQIAGLLNVNKKLSGFQVGLINMSDTADHAISIGLINIVKNGGYSEFEFSLADYQNLGLSFKHGLKSFYNIYNIGFNFLEDNLWSAGVGFGHLQKISNRLNFQPEALATTYFPEDFKHYKRTLTYRLKLGLVYSLSDKIGLSVAPSVYYADFQNDNNGLAPYKISSIKPFKSHTGSENQWHLGTGISVGLHLRNK